MTRWTSFLPLILAFVVAAIAASDLEASKATYKPSSSEWKLHDEYVVHFHPGYTLAEHQVYTGIQIQDQPSFRNMSFLPGYNARLSESELHDIVRHDPNVKLVHHNHWIRRIYLLLISKLSRYTG
jgi:hypothetical protein